MIEDEILEFNEEALKISFKMPGSNYIIRRTKDCKEENQEMLRVACSF